MAKVGDRWQDELNNSAEAHVMLFSKKQTDALSIRMANIHSGLDMTPLGKGRSREATSLRAAGISATQLIIQRAAIEMDISPEEFEVIEPRLRSGQPFLIIADQLTNGAGFSRRLYTEINGQPLVTGFNKVDVK